MITKEEFRNLYDDNYNDEEIKFESVDRKITDDWRHGNRVVEVFKLIKDGVETFIRCKYCQSGDGEWHGIYEDEFDIEEVEPYTETVVITQWRKK